jgi:hypothetical protein
MRPIAPATAETASNDRRDQQSPPSIAKRDSASPQVGRSGSLAAAKVSQPRGRFSSGELAKSAEPQRTVGVASQKAEAAETVARERFEPVEAATSQHEPIFDSHADATNDINAALKTALRENKRVLIEFGGNEFGECHLLHELFNTNSKLSAILKAAFVLVRVDAAANREVSARYLSRETQDGVPVLTVLDANGKQLKEQRLDELQIGPKRDPATLAAFLHKWSSSN